MNILGIDPGTQGGFAIIDGGGAIVELDDLPIHLVRTRKSTKAELDLHTLAVILCGHSPGHAYLEQVGSRPNQGIVSTGRFMYAAGSLYGLVVALGIPVSFVRPVDWQRHHRIGGAPDEAIRRALQLYPQEHSKLARKRDHNRADALMLALYGLAQIPVAKDMLHAAD
jgi:crossover junction endodeoxyribonuclease RuvC